MLFSNCYEATCTGNFELVKYLIRKDFSIIHHYNLEGQTLMHAAAACGHHPIIEWLHYLNCLLINQPDKNGFTPLDTAAFYGQITVIKAFINNPSFIRQTAQSKYIGTLSYLLKNGFDPNTTNPPLLLAAFKANQIEKVQLLIQYGAKTDVFENIYKNLSRNKKSLEFCKDHLFKWLKIFGGKFHPLIASIHSTIGRINKYLNNVEEAFANCSEAMEIHIRLPANDFDIAANICDQAWLYNHCKKYSEALSCLITAYNLYLKQPQYMLDVDSPIIECCHNIGIVYKNLEDIDQAETWYHRAIELKSQIVGQDNIRMVENYKYIAKFYEDIKSQEKASYYKNRAKTIEDNNSRK